MKLGFGELMIVLVVILLVIGPDKLPEFARKIGKALGEFRHATEDVSTELRENVLDPLDEAAAPIREAMEPLEELKSSVDLSVSDIKRNLGSASRISSRKKTGETKTEPAAAAPETEAEAVGPAAPEAVPAAEPAPETEEVIEAAADAAEVLTAPATEAIEAGAGIVEAAAEAIEADVEGIEADVEGIEADVEAAAPVIQEEPAPEAVPTKQD